MSQNWVVSWIASVPWDPSDRDAAVAWMRARPEPIRRLLIRFPPSSVVRSNLYPPPGGVGIVTSYYEPTAAHVDGLVGVRDEPDGGILCQCDPDTLEVVGYWQGLTPDVIATLLEVG